MAKRGDKVARIWGNLLLWVGTLFVCSILIELGLRLGFRDKINQFPRYVAEAQYGEYALRRLRAHSTFWHTSADGSWKFITNAQGFRDERDWPYEKPEGELRILALGDSNTQGYEVAQQETYARILEKYLQQHGVKARVLNTGISGFSTSEELLFLENEGVRYDPDIVILGFYANDYFDNVKAGLFGLEGGQLVLKKKSHIPGTDALRMHNDIAILRFLSENSLFYSFLMNTGWRFAKSRLSTETAKEMGVDYAVVKQSPSKDMVQLTMRLIERLYEVCRRLKVPLVILEIPQPGGGEGLYRPSVSADLQAAFRANSDVFLSADEVFGPYRGLAQMHVGHGDRHINAFSHLMLGIASGEAIMRLHVPAVAKWEVQAR